jgi:hypothetical protein
MRLAPDDFVNRLNDTFRNELRIRWSNKLNQWQIEQKINNPKELGYRFDDEWHDDAVRQRDGYALVCSVYPGDRAKCPKCNNELKIPTFKFGEVKCSYCALKGRESRVIAGFFPLTDLLIDHLKKLDPTRGWRDSITKAIEIKNEKIERSKEREIENHTEAVWKDNYNQIAGIPQVGYTGKEFKGV